MDTGGSRDTIASSFSHCNNPLTPYAVRHPFCIASKLCRYFFKLHYLKRINSLLGLVQNSMVQRHTTTQCL